MLKAFPADGEAGNENNAPCLHADRLTLTLLGPLARAELPEPVGVNSVGPHPIGRDVHLFGYSTGEDHDY